MSGRKEGIEDRAYSCTPTKPCPFPPSLSSVVLTLTSMLTMSVVSMYSVAPLIWYGLHYTTLVRE